MDSVNEAVVICSDNRLAEFLQELAQAPWVAVDTEADSLHSYPEKVCLIQVSIEGRDELIDPLASIDLGPLWEALAGRELMVHGCDYDLRMFKRDFDFTPSCVFDTKEAARLLGCMEFGLAALVRDVLDVKLDKGSQKANWSLRPLTARMEEYARSDTRHLFPLVLRLRSDLADCGRIEWHAEICRKLIEDYSTVVPVDEDRVWRLKGSSQFDPRQLAILRALWQWRENEAKRLNRPPFFIIAHNQLVALAKDGADGGSVWKKLPPRMPAKRKREIGEVVEEALKLPESEWPKRPKRVRTHRPPVPVKRFERVRDFRDKIAEKLKLDPTLIASKAMLERLAIDWDSASGELMGWQRELLDGALT